MKCCGMLFSALLLAVCCLPVSAQEESAEGKPDEADLKVQVRSLKLQLRDAQKSLAVAQKELANREKKIAKAAEQVDNAKEIAREKADQALRQLGAVAQAQMAEGQLVRRQVLSNMLKSVQAKQGSEHAYAQTLRKVLSDRYVQLQAELNRSASLYGAKHPRVLALRKQVEALDAQAAELKNAQSKQRSKANVRKMQDDDMVAAHKQKLAALKELAAVIQNSEYKQQLEGYKLKVEKERADLETRMKLVEKGNARKEAAQSTRLKQMLEMEERLKRAESLLSRGRDAFMVPGDAGAGPDRVAVGASKATGQRFDRLEQKLDKIASLLEKMIERDKE